jgi:hypothetical protein
MNDSRVVFINFLPGSFGSFLLKCLSASSTVFIRTKDSTFFDELGASHYDIPHYLENFHSKQDIDDWLELPDLDKQRVLTEYWNPPKEFIESDLYYIHRILTPKRTKEIKSYFPNSKVIKIIIPDKYVMTVLRMYETKRVPILKDRENNLGKVMFSYVTNNRNNDIIDGVYNFDVSHLMENTFLAEFDKLCEWLNFEKANVSEFYEKFKQLNGIKNEK